VKKKPKNAKLMPVMFGKTAHLVGSISMSTGLPPLTFRRDPGTGELKAVKSKRRSKATRQAALDRLYARLIPLEAAMAREVERMVAIAMSTPERKWFSLKGAKKRRAKK
jgi:hypothetical protein